VFGGFNLPIAPFQCLPGVFASKRSREG
jgi:hypothetical protein